MPLFEKLSGKNFSLALWRIEEDISFFESRITFNTGIANENKRLQWLASRYLLSQMVGGPVDIIKDASGKPSLRGNSHHISISHTPAFAGVIVSDTVPVGMDLEAINPKVERIAHKFLR